MFKKSIFLVLTCCFVTQSLFAQEVGLLPERFKTEVKKFPRNDKKPVKAKNKLKKIYQKKKAINDNYGDKLFELSHNHLSKHYINIKKELLRLFSKENLYIISHMSEFFDESDPKVPHGLGIVSTTLLIVSAIDAISNIGKDDDNFFVYFIPAVISGILNPIVFSKKNPLPNEENQRELTEYAKIPCLVYWLSKIKNTGSPNDSLSNINLKAFDRHLFNLFQFDMYPYKKNKMHNTNFSAFDKMEFYKFLNISSVKNALSSEERNVIKKFKRKTSFALYKATKELNHHNEVFDKARHRFRHLLPEEVTLPEIHEYFNESEDFDLEKCQNLFQEIPRA